MIQLLALSPRNCAARLSGVSPALARATTKSSDLNASGSAADADVVGDGGAVAAGRASGAGGAVAHAEARSMTNPDRTSTRLMRPPRATAPRTLPLLPPYP